MLKDSDDWLGRTRMWPTWKQGPSGLPVVATPLGGSSKGTGGGRHIHI